MAVSRDVSARAWTVAQAVERFLTPQAYPRPLTLPEGGERLSLGHGETRLALHRYGRGPRVLLVHGWEGSSADYAGFISPLLASGFALLLPDLPAHGDSAGGQTSLPVCAAALLALAAQHGPFQAVIAHSIGCGMVAEALRQGLGVQKAVFIAAPAEHARYADNFARWHGLHEARRTEFLLALAQRGVDPQRYSIAAAGRGNALPVLFAASSGDTIIPPQDSEACATHWPNARTLRVEGHGHLRMLQAPELIAGVCNYLTSPTGESP